MRVQNWKKQVFTIPNILSLFRLILIPVYIHIYLNAQSLADYHLAAAILAVSCLTDAVDGQIARRFNMITAVGKVLDPLADKILVSAAFIYLTAVGICPFWVSILIIFREFLVTGLRQLAVAQGQVIAADKLGKWKTTAQLTYCIACMTQLAYGGNLIEPLRSLSIGEIGWWFRELALWTSIILTLWSGLNYCYHSRHLLRD
jgi:CDP-diacylglycerol--glycerol-3-phosphate 3-phosphatidyltransferase